MWEEKDPVVLSISSPWHPSQVNGLLVVSASCFHVKANTVFANCMLTRLASSWWGSVLT